jgi:hypothetical protein
VNRHPTNLIQEKLQGDDPSYHGSIDKEADLLYDLAYHGIGGPVSSAEVPFCESYRQTTLDFGHQIDNDRLTWTLALVKDGAPAMVAGLYRLHYRVLNPRNAFIEEANSTHLDRATAERNKLNYLRTMKGLESLHKKADPAASIADPTLQSSSILLNPS